MNKTSMSSKKLKRCSVRRWLSNTLCGGSARRRERSMGEEDDHPSSKAVSSWPSFGERKFSCETHETFMCIVNLILRIDQ